MVWTLRAETDGERLGIRRIGRAVSVASLSGSRRGSCVASTGVDIEGIGASLSSGSVSGVSVR